MGTKIESLIYTKYNFNNDKITIAKITAAYRLNE